MPYLRLKVRVDAETVHCGQQRSAENGALERRCLKREHALGIHSKQELIDMVDSQGEAKPQAASRGAA